MPGEEKVTTSAQRPPREAKQSRQLAAGEFNPALAERIILIGVVLVTLTAGFYALLYFQMRSWQMLANAGCRVLGILCLVSARRLVRQGKLDAAGFWILGAVIAVFGVGELLWTNATVYLTLSVLLLMVFVSGMIRPRRWGIWVAVGGLYVIYVFLVNWFEPLPRYDITQSAVFRIYAPAVLLLLALAVVWQFTRAYQRIGTIRTRLLVAFILMVLLPATIISASWAVLGLQSGRQQVVNQLESVATLKEAEIGTWVNSLQTDLITVLTGEEVTQRTIALLQMPDPSKYLGYWVRNHFEQAVQQAGRFEELFLLDLQGKVILSTDVEQEGKTYSAQTFFREGLKASYVQSPFYFPSPDQMSVVVARPVLDGQGYVWGVLAGRTSLATLNEMMRERAGLGQTGETYLVGISHALLTESRFGQGQIYVRTQGANVAIENRSNGSGLYDGYRGVPIVGVYHWLPKLQVALLAEQDQSEAFSTIYVTLGVSVGVALASMLIAVVASLFITRGIANPLTKLAETATRIAAGDLERTAEVEREDEAGALAQAFNSMTAQLRDLISSLEQRVADRTRSLQTAAEVARATTSVLDLDELLRQAVDLIRGRFSLYYVGLFLLDEERRFAVLRAGAGEAGQKILEQGVRLEVGDTSIIGWCTAHAQPRLAQDVSQEAIFYGHPLLPDVRSEAALPLIARGRVIGALDVESAEKDAFDEADIAVMQTMADQLAVAIDNARLFTEAQAALEEMRATQRRYLGQAWAEYGQSAKKAVYETRRLEVAPLDDGVLPEIQQAMERQRVTTLTSPSMSSGRGDGAEGNNYSALVAPITLRGTVIGALGIHDEDGARQWTDDEIAIVEAITERVALAAENLRLLDETQRRAAREQMVSEIAGRVRASLDPDTILKTTVRELGHALGVQMTAVEITGPGRDDGGSSKEKPAHEREE